MKPVPATSSTLPAGIYRTHSAMGRLWTLLSDQKWHDFAEAAALIHPVNLQNRLRYLEKHGRRYGASHRTRVKTYDWDLQSNGRQIRMLLKQR